VNQEILLQVEYSDAENRILRAHAPARLRLSDVERATLAGIGKRLGRNGRAKVAQVAKSETMLGWWRKLVAQKFDWSSWGYDRIAGALANLGHEVSDQTVGNMLRRHGTAPANRWRANPQQAPAGRLASILPERRMNLLTLRVPEDVRTIENLVRSDRVCKDHDRR
jgi:hypothetical protein